MKKIFIIIFSIIISIASVMGQDTTEVKKTKSKPVASPWDSDIILDNQTTFVEPAKTLGIYIGHRFGLLNENGISDLFGIYAPGANIRIGANYTVYKGVSIGYGITLKNMYNDFSAKWNILQQKRDNKIPVAVTIYGNMAINGNSEETFGTDYTFSDRICYFSELEVSRKFADWCSLQASLNFTHYNSVDSTMEHDVLGLGFLGQFKFTSQSSFVLQYNIPLKIKSLSEQNNFDDSENETKDVSNIEEEEVPKGRESISCPAETAHVRSA